MLFGKMNCYEAMDFLEWLEREHKVNLSQSKNRLNSHEMHIIELGWYVDESNWSLECSDCFELIINNKELLKLKKCI